MGLAVSQLIKAHKYACALLNLSHHSSLIHPRTCSPTNTVQIVLSTAHPAKFNEAVTSALSSFPNFNFERDVLPKEFEGLLEKEKRVIDVEKADVGLVKAVIEDVGQKKEKGQEGPVAV